MGKQHSSYVNALAKGEVHYLPVWCEDQIIGYLWATASDDAAGFVRRADAPASYKGSRADPIWVNRLHQNKHDGLRPLQALVHWIGQPEGRRGGYIPADSRSLRLRDMRELILLADPDYIEPDEDPYYINRSLGWEPLSGVSLEELDQSGNYPFLTDSPVHYFEVTRRGVVLGYLWAAATDDAASYLHRDTADGDFHASSLWHARLKEAKQTGLTPLQVLNRWVGAPEDPKAGGIGSDPTPLRAPSLRALEKWALAGWSRTPRSALEPPSP